MSTIDALVECLETPGGCAVVPGLPQNQYQLTLITSVFGGLIAGYASRLQPEGAAQTFLLALMMPPVPSVLVPLKKAEQSLSRTVEKSSKCPSVAVCTVMTTHPSLLQSTHRCNARPNALVSDLT